MGPLGGVQIAAAAEPEAAAPSALVAPAIKPADIPVSAFAALPFLRSASLSPDGKRLVAVMNREGNSVLVTAGGDGSGMRGIMESDNIKFKFGWVRWVNNNRLIVGIRYPGIRRGFESTESRLLAMDADGGNIVNMVQPSRDKSLPIPITQDNVVAVMKDGRYILLELFEGYEAGGPSVFRVDVNTGKRELVLGPRRFVYDWIADRQGRVRVGTRVDGADIQIIACDPDGDNWRTVWRYKVFDADEIEAMGFGRDPQVLFVRAAHEGRQAVYEAHLDQLEASGKPKMVLRQSDPKYDIDGGLVISRLSGEAIGISEVVEGKAERAFWTEPMRELARGVDQALPNRFNSIHGFSEEENRYAVSSDGNGVPAQLYLGDRRSGSLNLLADLFPDLPPAAMVGKKTLQIQARDGLKLTVYLTRPKGADAQPGPLVLLPHGGPISRDDAGFDPWSEFLASRGYTVLQVDFRGSAGKGREFRNAGLRRWGLEMQDDLTDAVAWAVGEKYADPKRICVVGASYGGYAAMMGAIKTPDLYRCTMSFAGVTDLIGMSRRDATYSDGQSILDRQVGNYWRDREQLKATSPSERAAEIKIPLLLMHGTADRQVPFDQAETMVKALKAAGKVQDKDFKFIALTDGDNQLSRQSDNLRFFIEMEAFLDAHIGKGAPAR
jgi:dipeptidyl aminopeptidase/acylaminoacyl peptidase